MVRVLLRYSTICWLEGATTALKKNLASVSSTADAGISNRPVERSTLAAASFSRPDSLSFRIQGADTAWAVGGGRYGVRYAGCDAYWLSQDTLYPADPDAGVKTSRHAGTLVGAPVVRSDGGGHVVATTDLNNVGVANHTRRFVAEFGEKTGADAAYVICDTSDNGAFWQMCSLEENAFTTEGNTFTLTARNGATMKGTVLYPAGDLHFKTGTRPRGSRFLTDTNSFLHLQSQDGSYLIVLTVAKKGVAHPAVSATGTWGREPDGTVRIGDFSVAIQGTSVIPYP